VAHLLLLTQLASTWAMVGLIWLVQVVQYPLFGEAGRAAFPAYHAGHSSRITLVVAPLMLLELASAAALVLHRPAWIGPAAAWTGLAMAAGVWAVTAFVQVPQHAQLAGGFDAVVHRELVMGNWIRTALWTARGLLVLAWASAGLRR
jgi:hypothetical protein